MAVLARQRRRLAAAALAGSLAAGPSAALAQPRYAGRALALVLRALEDEPAFQVRARAALPARATRPAEHAGRWCCALSRTSRIHQMHSALFWSTVLEQGSAAACMAVHKHA